MTLSFAIGWGIDVLTLSTIQEAVVYHSAMFLAHLFFQTLNDLYIKQVMFYLFPLDLSFSPHTIQTSPYLHVIWASTFNLVSTKTHKCTECVNISSIKNPEIKREKARISLSTAHFKVLEAFSQVSLMA